MFSEAAPPRFPTTFRTAPADVHVIVRVEVGVEANLQPTQAVQVAELCVDQRHQMIPALERFVVGVTVQPVHNCLRLPTVDGFKQIPKDAIPKVHVRPFCVSTTRKDRSESVWPGMHRDIVNHSPDSPAASGGGMEQAALQCVSFIGTRSRSSELTAACAAPA